MIPVPIATHVSKKIRPEFPKTPEGWLMWAVIDRALRDSYSNDRHIRRDTAIAKQYLRGDMPHAEVCGVSSAWIRRVIRRTEEMFAELA